MSLIVDDAPFSSSNMHDNGLDQDQRDMDKLDQYLAIVENNRKASRFIPDDALLALDMAGFVRGCLAGNTNHTPVSAARLALSLVQPCHPAPMQ